MFQKGIIKTFNTERGFGFIRPEDGAKDIFFHIKDFPTGYAPKLQERVSYWVEQSGEKFSAKNITRLDVVKTQMPDIQDWQVQPVASTKPKTAPQNIAQAKAVLRSKSNPYVLSQKPLQRKRQHNRTGRLIGLILTFLVVATIGRWGFGYLQQQPTVDRPHQNIEAAETSQSQLYAAIQAPPVISEPNNEFTNKDVVLKSTQSIYDETKRLKLNDTTPIHQTVMSDKKFNESNISHSQYKCDGRTHCTQMRSYDEAVWFLQNCPNTQMDGDGDGQPCEKQFARNNR